MSHLNPHRSDADQIFQKYLDRAIVQINDLSKEVAACTLCEHGDDFQPVMGTGHPLADIFLLKYRPRSEELDEGVAFFGRAGQAIQNSAQRLNMDMLDIYGTNCVKCSDEPDACMREHCPHWLREELRIVDPRLLVIMGDETLATVNRLGYDDAEILQPYHGTLQAWRPNCLALLCPDIDESLDAPASKRAFWEAFRNLNDWYQDKPPF